MGTNPYELFEQSVTMTAKMWPQANNTATGGGWEWGWRVPAHHWPLLVAMFCGGSLVLLLLVAAILWHCCVAPHRNKDYRVKMDGESLPQMSVPVVVPVLPSHSAVFVEPKCGEWGYNSRLVRPHWFYNSQLMGGARCSVPLPRSLSVPTPAPPPARRKSSPARVVCPPHDSGTSSIPLPLPHISEFSPGCHVQYASSSILDEYGSRNLYPSVGGVMLKTQSLPACVRSRPRPVSTADDLSELYAKVNFSKKRKNRMRNDEAAIIALSKSRSQFLHKDTDSLVDNEAVIVYDELTAL
ncbi:uncharacterized protein LOC128999606 [Macrosteles quadrilineatus]|uniref:uncharacterized protein LOC128999606 n=1 Tax=Macrosteles quadrilineatus TaxID=74068 RepID=UPI0023E3287A|nr:uncharacterized protein LOC128999606 [Macrosteles quadrilineatus]